MGIQAKRESLSRIVGMILILIGLILTIFLDLFVIINPLINVILILIELLWFFFSVFLKLEKSYFTDHFFQIFLVILCFSIFLIIIGIVFNSVNSVFLVFIFKVISNLLIIICWHFCLSLYKKEKIIFFFSGVGYVILSLIFGFKVIILKIGGYAIIPLTLITLGMVIIMISEKLMKRKGLLNYI